MATQTRTGLAQADAQRWHFDIYAIFEGPQELYFGHEAQVNVNVVERVKVDLGNNEVIDKCYMSPTKRRGVERRILIWAPTPDGWMLGDKLGCGIPHTCAQSSCPICSVYGGLITKNEEAELADGSKQKRKATTLIGRLVHGGGVAVQDIEPSEKQRAMHPSMIQRSGEASPQPFKREYNEPGLLYPVYNHAMSIGENEFAAVAYAFLESLARLGAGNPKGLRIYEDEFDGAKQPLLVVDKYLTPWGKRPIVSPAIVDKATALDEFRQAALAKRKQPVDEKLYQRFIGDAALHKLQDYAMNFTKAHLIQEE